MDAMSQETWSKVDEFFVDALFEADPVLDQAVQATLDADMPQIQVSVTQGRMLNLLATMTQARRILEVGTLGGYSTIWLGRALPADGRLITLEINPDHAAVARGNLERAGLAGKVAVRVGRAIETLAELEAEDAGPFDLVFIDADKPSNPDYVASAIRLGRPGTVIVVDNVVRAGAVANPANTDPMVDGVRRMLDTIAANPRVAATAIQTVGTKGYDGFALLVIGD